jgi:hypothetical protein
MTTQTRFTDAGEVVAEKLLEGDRGEQGALLAAPAQTGEGLALKTLPLFAAVFDRAVAIAKAEAEDEAEHEAAWDEAVRETGTYTGAEMLLEQRGEEVS